MDVHAIEAERLKAISGHQEWLKIIVESKLNFPAPEVWAKSVVKDMAVDLSDSQAVLLGNRLGAAYEYQKESFGRATASRKQFNVTKHDGDWHDNQLLYYLCDPTIHILTDDVELKQKCGSSDQRDRVLLLKEF